MAARVLVTLLAWAGIFLSPYAEAGVTKPWLAFGEMRGYLEPCGCDPATDMGGLRRLQVLLARERAMRPDLVVFDLGNNLAIPGVEPQSRIDLKRPYLTRGLASIAPTASLFNIVELGQKDALAQIFKNSPRDVPNWILSNLKASKTFVKPFVEIGEWFVTGYVWSPEVAVEVGSILEDEQLSRFQALAKKAGSQTKVLLFSGPDEHLDLLRKSKLFDLIVSASKSSLKVHPGAEERARPFSLKRSGDGDEEVWSVPLGGQGLLRGGSARGGEAKPLSEIINASNNRAPKERQVFLQMPPVKASVEFTWLDLRHGGEDAFKDLFADYRKASSNQFEQISKLREQKLKNSPFAGSQVCASCHVDAYAKWKASKHAVAYHTLVEKKRDTDPECVSCHVLAASEDGGFVSIKASPQFANVNCENCHGPALAHSKNPAAVKPTGLAKEVCLSCHYDPHSPAFNYEEYWKRIEHK